MNRDIAPRPRWVLDTNVVLSALIRPGGTVGRPPPTPECRDPHDLPFLHVALTARAAALVTGDDDLLTMRATHGVRIMSAVQAIERLSR